MESFETIIRNYYPLSDDSMSLLLPHVSIISYPKDVCFIKKGSIKKEMYFIAKGLIRLSFNIQNKEYTLFFGMEKDFFTSGLNYTEAHPSAYNFITIKDSTFYVIDKLLFENIMNTNLEIARLAIRLIDRERLDGVSGIIRHKCYPPMERYKHVLNICPEIFHYLSVNQTAAFLGINNSSLSRIRKKIIEEEREKNKHI